MARQISSCIILCMSTMCIYLYYYCIVTWKSSVNKILSFFLIYRAVPPSTLWIDGEESFQERVPSLTIFLPRLSTIIVRAHYTYDYQVAQFNITIFLAIPLSRNSLTLYSEAQDKNVLSSSFLSFIIFQ